MKIKFLETFQDGNIFKDTKAYGEVLVLDANIVMQIVRSGGLVQLLDEETQEKIIEEKIEKKVYKHHGKG